MLADFLFTPKQQRILALFLLRPTQTFAISDIFERAGGGRSSTQTFIKSLVDAQVLVLDTSRRASHKRSDNRCQPPSTPVNRRFGGQRALGLRR